MTIHLDIIKAIDEAQARLDAEFDRAIAESRRRARQYFIRGALLLIVAGACFAAAYILAFGVRP